MPTTPNPLIRNWTPDETPDLTGKTILITGGTVIALGDPARIEDVLAAMGSSELAPNVKPSNETFKIP